MIIQKKIEKYCLSLLWVTNFNSKDLPFVYGETERELINKVFIMPFKHAYANPLAEVNLWIDSGSSNPEAIKRTKEVFEKLKDSHNLPNLKLRDIRDIPIVRDNSLFFSKQNSLYLRVDLLKHIINIHCIESEMFDASVFLDFSISERSPVPDHQIYFGREFLTKLGKYGMLNGINENQFFMLINNPAMIDSLKSMHLNKIIQMHFKRIIMEDLNPQLSYIYLRHGFHLNDYFFKVESINFTNDFDDIDSKENEENGLSLAGVYLDGCRATTKSYIHDHSNYPKTEEGRKLDSPLECQLYPTGFHMKLQAVAVENENLKGYFLHHDLIDRLKQNDEDLSLQKKVVKKLSTENPDNYGDIVKKTERRILQKSSVRGNSILHELANALSIRNFKLLYFSLIEGDIKINFINYNCETPVQMIIRENYKKGFSSDDIDDLKIIMSEYPVHLLEWSQNYMGRSLIDDISLQIAVLTDNENMDAVIKNETIKGLESILEIIKGKIEGALTPVKNLDDTLVIKKTGVSKDNLLAKFKNNIMNFMA